MSQDIVTKTENDPIDFFKGFGQEQKKKSWLGTLLKFVKGDFHAGVGEDTVEVPLATRFIVMMPSLLTGWIKWQEGHPVAHEMGLVLDGFKAAKRADLGDTDQSLWEEDDNGNRRDPWQPGHYVVFVDADTHEVYTFASGSKGGSTALGELALKYYPHAKMSPTQVPVVEIGASSYKHKTLKTKISFPVFKIVAWEEQAEFLELLAAARDEADEVEAPKKSAPKRIAVKPMAATKGKAKGKNNGKRPVRFA